METGYGYSYALNQMGGIVDLPCAIYSNLPAKVTATQINLTGYYGTTTTVGGRVITQITGDYADGNNINFPGN